MGDHDPVGAVSDGGADSGSDQQPIERGEFGAVQREQVDDVGSEPFDEFGAAASLPQHPVWVCACRDRSTGGDHDDSRHSVIIASTSAVTAFGLHAFRTRDRPGIFEQADAGHW